MEYSVCTCRWTNESLLIGSSGPSAGTRTTGSTPNADDPGGRASAYDGNRSDHGSHRRQSGVRSGFASSDPQWSWNRPGNSHTGSLDGSGGVGGLGDDLVDDPGQPVLAE